MEHGDRVEAHDIARRIVQHEAEAVEVNRLLQQRDQVAKQTLEIAARRGCARHLGQQALEGVRGLRT